MKRIVGRVMSIVGTTLVAGSAAPACAQNDVSLFIHGLIAPPTNRQGGVCTYTADPGQAQLFEGRLDIGVRDNYFGVLLVANQLIPRGDPTQTRAESNRMHLDGAIVRVTFPDGGLIREFTSYGMGFADPAVNNAPGFGTIGVALFDPPTADLIRPQLPDRNASRMLLLNVKVFGKTLGGVDVESGEYQVPIRVCNGCLVSFASGNDPAVSPQPNCAKALEATTLLPCAAGQDELVPCQLCQGRPACDPRTP